jgi:rare lipoprotein A
MSAGCSDDPSPVLSVARRALGGRWTLLPLLVAAGCSGPAVLPDPDGPGSAGRTATPPGPQPASPAVATPAPKPAPKPAVRAAPAPSAARSGRYYMDDGPDGNPPLNLDLTPDAQPRAEPLHPRANRPYVVFGKSYVPKTQIEAHRERGVASWYGRKFHGSKTSTGEVYDMYSMTAAHPTLPIPSYARVTNLRNGKTVIVRVNDRGPFLHRRVIDLSYTAAYKLGYVNLGSTEVDVELIRVDGVAPLAMQAAVKSDVADLADAAAQADAAQPGDTVALRLTFETIVVGEPGPDRNAAAPAPSPSPAAVPSSAAVPPSAAVPAAGSGSVYLQLGAFASRDNAEAARARFARELDWLQAPFAVLAQGSSYKVQVGPWPRREDAGIVAERIAREMDFRPLPVLR